VAPRPPQGPLPSLPPILRSTKPSSVPVYSKGPRGLSVLLRVRGIFTATSISPSPWLRQRASRYAVHARQNLPDKELRYLRTVIVTAAVYRCFSRQLSPTPLTFRHRAGVTLYTSTYVFAQSCVFDKQSPAPVSVPSEEGPLIPKLRGEFA